ncbi:MAG: DNA repair protein RadC [Candidatus Nomurabacteria bacterium]|nr:MAG: DNA repair protein RadC [Candidatus Nomurabacteria bacterium]
MKVTELKKTELPREKMEKYGAKRLKNFELIAIVLGSGIKGCNVLELARKIEKLIIQKSANNVTLEDLRKIRGLGKTKAIQVLAIISLVDRLGSGQNSNILSIKDVWNLCSDFRSSKKEHIVAFYLDTQQKLIERRIISVGTLDTSLAHPREVFEPALQLSAAGVVLAHNHPSGSVEPSDDDIAITKRMADAGDLLGITLIDHIIVSDKEFRAID